MCRKHISLQSPRCSGYLVPPVSAGAKACWYSTRSAFPYRLRAQGTWSSAEGGCSSSQGAGCGGAQAQHQRQGHSCSGVLLDAGRSSGCKAPDSQLNSKLQRVPLPFHSTALSQKAAICIHRAVICSCFKALPCPSDLLWSQEELADLNRGLSH